MSAPPFTKKHIGSLTHHQDIIQYCLGSNRTEIDERLDEAIDQLNHVDYLPGFSEVRRVQGELLFIPKSFEDKVYLRYLNSRLRAEYRVRQVNRRDVVSQIRNLLRADTPLHILRTDVRRFFFSVNFFEILKKLELEAQLSSREIASLRCVAEHTAGQQGGGVPWGLPISSTLAEIFMRPLDNHIRRIKGVYYYQRFVDDIIVFSTNSAVDIRRQIEAYLSVLPRKMLLNQRKTHSVDEQSISAGGTTRFCYLGYEFTRTLAATPTVQLAIAPHKLEKMRIRIRLTINQFQRDGKFSHLYRRLQLLSGNYSITKSNHDAPIQTGIYYNYPLINEPDDLARMSAFLKQQTIILRSRMKRLGRPIPPTHVRKLFRFCFVVGFKKRIMHKFGIREIQALSSIWKYAA